MTSSLTSQEQEVCKTSYTTQAITNKFYMTKLNAKRHVNIPNHWNTHIYSSYTWSPLITDSKLG